MIYLDNSATSYPKPKCVIDAVCNSFHKFGANSGRGAYEMAFNTTEEIYKCRNKISEFFNANDAENVIFTYNCTTALNMAIKGIASKNTHFIISDLEHNAVLRPLETLKQRGVCDYSIAKVSIDDYQTIKNFRNEIRDNTVAIVCTGASNVFGIIPPYKMISKLAHKNNLIFILDCSQIAGVLSIDMHNDNIDIVCCAGHKGLMGPTGTGFMIVNNKNIYLKSLIEGGTGSNSASATQPDILPDKFESGTPNIQGIIGLSAAIDFLKKVNLKNIYEHEVDLLKFLQKNLKNLDGVNLYTDFFDAKQRLAPILSLNIKNMHSEDVAESLSNLDICVRAGLHCAPLAHEKFGTSETGTVRISPSAFTQKKQIDFLINSIIKIAKLN
ncbi:MAG: aminotransferase class V-fold PLP-dependent enzyme [Clostridia bacterium]|nr:aminotransferase class V-fold PLP-dependent enzyme [Clostridia bacterium]